MSQEDKQWYIIGMYWVIGIIVTIFLIYFNIMTLNNYFNR